MRRSACAEERATARSGRPWASSPPWERVRDGADTRRCAERSAQRTGAQRRRAQRRASAAKARTPRASRGEQANTEHEAREWGGSGPHSGRDARSVPSAASRFANSAAGGSVMAVAPRKGSGTARVASKVSAVGAPPISARRRSTSPGSSDVLALACTRRTLAGPWNTVVAFRWRAGDERSVRGSAHLNRAQDLEQRVAAALLVVRHHEVVELLLDHAQVVALVHRGVLDVEVRA